MQTSGDRQATAAEVWEFGHRAPRRTVLRVMRQRVIAEMLERAAARAERDGRKREASEMREQAAQARKVADDVIRANRARAV